ncbi:hypothetical protein SLS63_000831 [Diaporthe eres]|uniref:PWI domain-containing protein n=1 Tax=Diaporthe eres TaxID=83184 RepID=A0ABR1PNZ3_DIAER
MATGVDAKLLKSTKFPPEFSQKVDMTKVNLQVMKKWIAGKISEILGSEDDVVIELCFNLIEGSRYTHQIEADKAAEEARKRREELEARRGRGGGRVDSYRGGRGDRDTYRGGGRGFGHRSRDNSADVSEDENRRPRPKSPADDDDNEPKTTTATDASPKPQQKTTQQRATELKEKLLRERLIKLRRSSKSGSSNV